MQIPVGVSEDFNGIIDVLTRKWQHLKVKWDQIVKWHDVPAEYKDQVEELRTKIVEAACDFDDVVG